MDHTCINDFHFFVEIDPFFTNGEQKEQQSRSKTRHHRCLSFKRAAFCIIFLRRSQHHAARSRLVSEHRKTDDQLSIER
jgi:hypothetical protein